MRRRVGANSFVFRGLVGGAPHHAGHLPVARVLRHLGRENSQEGMSIGHARAAGKNFGRAGVILQIHVADEAFVVIKAPLVGIVADAELFQFDGAFRHAAPLGGFGARKLAPNSYATSR